MNQVKRALRHVWRPGEAVPESGIYKIRHAACSAQPVDLVFVAGEYFPACPKCGQDVIFELERATPHISEDSDFRT